MLFTSFTTMAHVDMLDGGAMNRVISILYYLNELVE